MTMFVKRIVGKLGQVQIKEPHVDVFSNEYCFLKYMESK